MISIGLVGCGAVVHEMYTKALIDRPAYRVAYVCDTNSEQAASAAELFGAEVVELDGIADKADAIVVSTPPSTHKALVRACFRPGKTILCEKPYMTTGEDAMAVAREAKEVGTRLYVGHFRRTFPQLALAQQIVSLGMIGDVTEISACEGGRFTWRTVSEYVVRDVNGGVLWDTGSHTLDMALFASGLDRATDFGIEIVKVEKDKPEPSHDFLANFRLSVDGTSVEGHLHVSRKETLPNLVEVVGTLGRVSFVTGLDDRIRITNPRGSTILHAATSYVNLLEGFDLQLRRIFLSDRDEDFLVDRFVGQIRLLEALASA
jgi:predicted dehydrogenase